MKTLWEKGWIRVAVISIVAVTVVWVGGRQPTGAWQAEPQAFRNPIEQREQMIKELREIKLLLKEQNNLLRGIVRSGETK